jgi:hypothetical protein
VVSVSPKYRVRLAFALFAVAGILALFVLDGAAAGAAALAALLLFIVACIGALSRQDADARRHGDRTGLAGWFGGWF